MQNINVDNFRLMGNDYLTENGTFFIFYLFTYVIYVLLSVLLMSYNLYECFDFHFKIVLHMTTFSPPIITTKIIILKKISMENLKLKVFKQMQHPEKKRIQPKQVPFSAGPGPTFARAAGPRKESELTICTPASVQYVLCLSDAPASSCVSLPTRFSSSRLAVIDGGSPDADPWHLDRSHNDRAKWR